MTKEQLAEQYAKDKLRPIGAANHFLAGYQAAKEEGWIRVEDRLPEESQSLLVYGILAGATKPIICYAKFFKGNTYTKTEFWASGNLITVSHWQPLPPTPQTK